MTDDVYEMETESTPEVPEEAPVLEEDSAPEASPEPVEAAPVPDSEPAPDVPSDPVEVVTVEDLLDRLTGKSQEDGQTEEPPSEEEPADYVPENDLSAAQADGGPIEIAGMDKALKHLEIIQETVDHPSPASFTSSRTSSLGASFHMLLMVIVTLSASCPAWPDVWPPPSSGFDRFLCSLFPLWSYPVLSLPAWPGPWKASRRAGSI